MPLKIFVLLAGATAYAPWRLVAALVVGRGSRHCLEAGLAAAYRDEAIRAFERYGATLALARARRRHGGGRRPLPVAGAAAHAA